MTYEVEYTERARDHLTQAVDWIADRSSLAAERWITELEKTVQSLQTNPERYPPAPENQSHEIAIQQVLFGKRRGQYRILYTIAESKVVVLDVRHSMREWLEPGELDS